MSFEICNENFKGQKEKVRCKKINCSLKFIWLSILVHVTKYFLSMVTIDIILPEDQYISHLFILGGTGGHFVFLLVEKITYHTFVFYWLPGVNFFFCILMSLSIKKMK